MRTDLWRRADRLNEEARRLEATLPTWAKELPGVDVDFYGRKPTICRTPGEVETAMFWVGFPARLLNDKPGWERHCTKVRQYQSDKIEELMVQGQRQAEARKEVGLKAIAEEIDNVDYETLEIERLICETQVSTLQGLAVQALMIEDLEKDSPPYQFSSALAKSMGIAARKLVPELREG
jgi:hypothetical protein